MTVVDETKVNRCELSVMQALSKGMKECLLYGYECESIKSRVAGL